MAWCHIGEEMRRRQHCSAGSRRPAPSPLVSARSALDLLVGLSARSNKQSLREESELGPSTRKGEEEGAPPCERKDSVVCGRRPDGQECRDVGGDAPWLRSGSSRCSSSTWAVRLGDLGAIDGTFWLLAVGDDVKRVHRVPMRRSTEMVWLLVCLLVILSLAHARIFAAVLYAPIDYELIDQVTDIASVAMWVGLVVGQWLMHGCTMASWLVQHAAQCCSTDASPSGAILHCVTHSDSLPAWASLTACKLIMPWLSFPSSSLSLGPLYYGLALWHSAVAVLTLLLIALGLTPSLPRSTALYCLGGSARQTARQTVRQTERTVRRLLPKLGGESFWSCPSGRALLPNMSQRRVHAGGIEDLAATQNRENCLSVASC